jgi:ATP-dependent Clp protease adapter protein ClpS
MNFMNNVVLSVMSKTNSKNKRGNWAIVLHNDRNVSFDHVIDCLVDICSQNEFQAHQCALITHTKKHCTIYVDSHSSCLSTAEILSKFGLTVTIEKYETNS